MYIKFHQNRVSRSVKTVHTIYLQNNCKLDKFATCNLIFETCVTKTDGQTTIGSFSKKEKNTENISDKTDNIGNQVENRK